MYQLGNSNKVFPFDAALFNKKTGKSFSYSVNKLSEDFGLILVN